MLRLGFRIVLLMCVGTAAATTGQTDERGLVVKTCATCHDLDYHITPRSRKSWELTVYNMRDFIWDGTQKFSDDVADRIVDHLAEHFGTYSTNSPAVHFAGTPSPYGTYYTPLPTDVTDATPTPATSADMTEQPSPTHAQPIQVARAQMPPEISNRLANPRRKPSPALLLYARHSGYAAVFFLFTLLLSGHSRRRLRTAFRPVHIAAALGLFLSLASHGLIYLLRYGNPPVVWYWYGLAAFCTVVTVEMVGIMRKQMGRRFLRLHMAGGYMGLGLAILHWIWAWL